jgi:HNH endonuclease
MRGEIPIIQSGSNCKLYKECKICGEVKYITYFPTKGGRKCRGRKSFCKMCKERRHEKILENLIPYSFDISNLEDREDIRIRGKLCNGKRYESWINIVKAKTLVEEGRAGIVHKGLIHNLYDKRSFREMILKRDSYICYYCGNYGDTVDHIIPRSKGGLSTPKNCVCACERCNVLKADSDIIKVNSKKEN